MDNNPILTPSGAKGKRLKLVEFVSAEALEVARREGWAASELKDRIDAFVDDLATARRVYQDPHLRQFLDLPEAVVEREFDLLRATSGDLWEMFSAFVLRWGSRCTSGKCPGAGGGAA